MRPLIAVVLRAVTRRRVWVPFVIVLVVAFWSRESLGDVFVRGYVRGNGTYVAPHFRSDPDGIESNNWSVFPNVNPHTGKPGSSAAAGPPALAGLAGATLYYLLRLRAGG